MKNDPVKDLCIDDAHVTLILESPHLQEVEHDIPLAGDSGLIVSRGLFSNVDLAAGFHISNGGAPCSVMNTFQFALQLSDKMKDLNNSIGLLSYKTLGPRAYKDALKLAFSENPLINEFKDSYIQRLTSITVNRATEPKIIVCGFIAQAFFEYALNIQNLFFGKIGQCGLSGKRIHVLYVEHPSTKNSSKFWTVNTANNKKLRSFAQCS